MRQTHNKKRPQWIIYVQPSNVYGIHLAWLENGRCNKQKWHMRTKWTNWVTNDAHGQRMLLSRSSQLNLPILTDSRTTRRLTYSHATNTNWLNKHCYKKASAQRYCNSSKHSTDLILAQARSELQMIMPHPGNYAQKYEQSNLWDNWYVSEYAHSMLWSMLPKQHTSGKTKPG